jgi:hypothetical protein
MSVRGLTSTGLAVLALGLVATAQAFGASPPTVNDVPAFASSVTQVGATLNGTIDPEGIPTSYHFVYGPTAAYGSVAPFPDKYVPVNEADDAVSEVVGELTPGTTYHFALVANSPAGDVVGPDETLTTPPVPVPAVVTGGAAEVTVGSATLSGSVDPQGFETGYYFEYGSTTAYGSRWPGLPVAIGGLTGAQPIVSLVQNLLPGTLYHYRLVALNPGGAGYGADQTLVTQQYPVSAIQEAPVLTGTLGINPETGSGSHPEVKHRAKHHKAKKTRKKTRGHKK